MEGREREERKWKERRVKDRGRTRNTRRERGKEGGEEGIK